MRCTDFLSDSYLPFKYNAWPDMPVLLCTYRYDAEQAKSLPCMINPRRACAARVTVVGSVCVSVCLLLVISLLECSFISRSVAKLEHEKANMQIHNGLLRHDRPACSVYLRVTVRRGFALQCFSFYNEDCKEKLTIIVCTYITMFRCVHCKKCTVNWK